MPKNNPALFEAIFEADKILQEKTPKKGEGSPKAPSAGKSSNSFLEKSIAKKEEVDAKQPNFNFDELLSAVKSSLAKDTKPARKPREKPSEEAYKKTLEILAKGREARKAKLEAKKGEGSPKAPSVEKPPEEEGSPKSPSIEKPEPPKIPASGGLGGGSHPPPVEAPKPVESPVETQKIPVSGGSGGGLRPPVIFGKNFRANISRR